MRGLSERGEIEARVLAWMREADPTPDDERFEAIALDLFRFQYAHCTPYRRFCDGRGLTPRTVRSWREIPAVPTGAFKEVALRCFPPERTLRIFRSSGTTIGQRSELHLDSLALYEASLVPSFERFVLPDLARAQPVRLLVLASPGSEAPDSSLSHMFQVMVERRGDGASGFFVRDGRLETGALGEALEKACVEEVPLALCGTAFAFVHLLETMREEGRRLQLPRRTRLMETGGFKGRVREQSPEVLYDRIEAVLGVPASRIVNQYGMTELGSQFYDSVLRFPDQGRRKLGPPWARVRILDPESGVESAPGAPGMIQVLDLANTGSIAAVQTTDLGRLLEDGFEVIGRAVGAEARGCSIGTDEMLDPGP